MTPILLICAFLNIELDASFVPTYFCLKLKMATLWLSFNIEECITDIRRIYFGRYKKEIYELVKKRTEESDYTDEVITFSWDIYLSLFLYYPLFSSSWIVVVSLTCIGNMYCHIYMCTLDIICKFVCMRVLHPLPFQYLARVLMLTQFR